MGKRTIHKSRGKDTGLGICAYFAMLFQANEALPKDKKKTDEQIAWMVEREFPNRPTAHVYRGQTKRRTINEYRHRYNTGKFTSGIVPAIYSFRYNSQGERVDGKTGKELLSNIQVNGLMSQARYWHKESRKAVQDNS